MARTPPRGPSPAGTRPGPGASGGTRVRRARSRGLRSTPQRPLNAGPMRGGSSGGASHHRNSEQDGDEHHPGVVVLELGRVHAGVELRAHRPLSGHRLGLGAGPDGRLQEDHRDAHENSRPDAASSITTWKWSSRTIQQRSTEPTAAQKRQRLAMAASRAMKTSSNQPRSARKTWGMPKGKLERSITPPP